MNKLKTMYTEEANYCYRKVWRKPAQTQETDNYKLKTVSESIYDRKGENITTDNDKLII